MPFKDSIHNITELGEHVNSTESFTCITDFQKKTEAD